MKFLKKFARLMHITIHYIDFLGGFVVIFKLCKLNMKVFASNRIDKT